jgi:hypothetical protein
MMSLLWARPQSRSRGVGALSCPGRHTTLQAYAVVVAVAMVAAPALAATNVCGPPDGGGTSIARGGLTWVCITLGGATAVFTPSADELSMLEVSGSFAAYATNSTAGSAGAPVLLTVASLGARSEADASASAPSAKLYAATLGGERTFVPTYTAIVHVERGVAARVTFDEGCFFCEAGGPACLPNALSANATRSDDPPVDAGSARSCTLREAECAQQSTPDNPLANSCDLKLFVVWTGTDVDGMYFTSAGRRFSRFAAFPTGLVTLWGSITSAVGDALASLHPLPPAA